MTAIDTLTREARIRCMSNERLQAAIDGVLELRHSGTDPKWTDPELRDLRAEQVRRGPTPPPGLTPTSLPPHPG